MRKIILLLSFYILITNVKAQVVTIPDTSFKNYLLGDTLVNSNQDALLQLSEIQAVTHLDVSNLGISDLTGINSFSNLANLNCSNNQLSILDISGNVEIDTLICDSNNLTSVCINRKHYQNILEFPINWVKDSICEWNRTNCSIESENCFALFYTTFDSTASTFYLWVDSLTTANAVSFITDFGDGNPPSPNPNAANFYNCDCIYDVCMKITTVNGDSCEYCHTLGLAPPNSVLRHGGFGDGYIVKVMQFVDTTVVDTVVVDTTVGIDSEIPLPTNYTIHPNPTSGIVNVMFNESAINISIRLLSLTGQAIIEQRNRSGYNFILDISDQAKGLYFMEVIQDGIVSISKVIKQ